MVPAGDTKSNPLREFIATDKHQNGVGRRKGVSLNVRVSDGAIAPHDR